MSARDAFETRIMLRAYYEPTSRHMNVNITSDVVEAWITLMDGRRICETIAVGPANYKLKEPV